MEKKLPKMFTNAQEKKFNNNEKIYYSKDGINNQLKSNQNIEKNYTNKTQNEKNIYQKLNDIFSSERYVYKAEVDIMTKDGKITTQIIGQNKTHIITMDNKLIPITDIEDISFTQ